MKWISLPSLLCLALGFFVSIMPGGVTAQLAPTGAHYGGRASDTGHAGLMNASGGYSTIVPIDLPVAGGSIPIPVQISYGARGVGAVGQGWDIPLSFVRRTTSLARHKPVSGSDSAPEGRERVVLSLLGHDFEMVPSGPIWVARRDAPTLSLRQEDGGWKLFDGNGLTYTFVENPLLAGSGIWLLMSINASAGASLQLEYQITLHSFPAGGNGFAIDLVGVRYNIHPTQSCHKHEITLTYGQAYLEPLSLSMLESGRLIRMHTLKRLDVMSRPDCESLSERLRRYEFSYQEDADTQQPQLHAVNLFGRQGSQEENTSVPVATYGYGTASYKDAITGVRKLRYLETKDIALPSEVDNNIISSTVMDPTVTTPSGGKGYSTSQILIDVTGDGRPELIYPKHGKLWVAINHPGEEGSTTLGQDVGIGQLSDMTFAGGALGMYSSANSRFAYSSNGNADEVWLQAIDVNGDGRIDIINAAEEANKWVVYLNTPGDGNSGVRWTRRSFEVASLRKHLSTRQHKLNSDFIPLSRRFTARDKLLRVCWVFKNSGWESFNGECGTSTDNLESVIIVGGEKTFTEWELTDLNGDGYPDVVFNSSPVDLVQSGKPNWTPRYSDLSPHYGYAQNGFLGLRIMPRLGDLNQIEAVYNNVGVRFDESHSQFSSPKLVLSQAECGVSRWEQRDENDPEQLMACGIADVNGDGLQDRIDYRAVRLGNGTGFSTVHGEMLPDFLLQYSDQISACKPPGLGTRKFSSYYMSGLRDLTGDGIPDFVQETKRNHSSCPPGYGCPLKVWQVFIGTGTGFASPIDVEVAGGTFWLSSNTESCDGQLSQTIRGLYDIDGDGKPELVGLNGEKLKVFHLAGGWVPKTPEAGRLVEINNGYGAKTSIIYRSAKEDGTTPHQVPFPEIVVTSVETVGAYGLGGRLGAVRYAYGDAHLVFDSSNDVWTLPAYGRSIEMRTRKTFGKSVGTAIITDTYGLKPFAVTMSEEERFGRYLTVGRVREVHVLSGSIDADPWAMLTTDTNTDARRIGRTHYNWGTRLIKEPPSPNMIGVDCLDMVFQYDFRSSFLASVGPVDNNVCSPHGFGFVISTESWRGDAPPPSNNNVETRSEVLEIDDFGRATLTFYENDRFRTDDDICIQNTFAQPTTTFPRVLNALGSQKVAGSTVSVDPTGKSSAGCGNGVIYASESWAYDGLVEGVSHGHITSHNVDRRATDTGSLLTSVHLFDATYDIVGNLVSMRTQRDESIRTVTLAYDPFRLVPVSARIDATGVPSMEASVNYDPISFEPLSSTDVNQTVRGTVFDGLGRLIRSTVIPPGGSLGVISTASYDGFSGTDPIGRRIVASQFRDPVKMSDISTAVGQISTVFLDELGRERRTELSLGRDYSNEVLVIGSRTYDDLGRIAFEADPYPISQEPTAAYGTSYHFQNTGELNCIIRGRGHQSLNMVTDVAIERFPTCLVRSFVDHVETLDVRDAASLQTGSPQAGVVKRIVSSAIGRILEQWTFGGGIRLEHATYGYDRLGQQTMMTRFLDPERNASSVQWSWHLDSVGQTLQLEEAETAIRSYTYSDWGELIETQWSDGSIDRRLLRKYDALGRLTATEERNNGVPDPETINRYAYDIGVNVSPLVSPTSVLGRLTEAKAPTGARFFSYDGFGRVNARTFIDNEGVLYIEKTEHHADGRLATLELNLPDHDYATERIEYGYDSSARLRTITHIDPTGTRNLYTAETIDPFGRVRKATYGQTSYEVKYNDEGRRLMSEAKIESHYGSRRTKFLSYDSLGRELLRHETVNGAESGSETNVAYDAVGRLASTVKRNGTAILSNWKFGYDALGNIRGLIETIGPSSITLRYGTNDMDRLCRIGYGNEVFDDTACNVVHDVLGNVVLQHTRNGSRRLSYFSSGGVRTITEEGMQARFAYDAFGRVQQLDIRSSTIQNERHDRRYGELIERQDTVSDGSTTSILTRHIPGPGGIVASRRGPSDEWVFGFSELRGNRFFTDQNGTFIQEIEYQPFGEATSIGAAAGSRKYTSYQWNGGDALVSFNLSHLGARVYDPVIGRFLSRDPLIIPRSGGTTNPYSFAMNDPMNGSDPSGLDCVGENCKSWPIILELPPDPGSKPKKRNLIEGTWSAGGALAAFAFNKMILRPILLAAERRGFEELEAASREPSRLDCFRGKFLECLGNSGLATASVAYNFIPQGFQILISMPDDSNGTTQPGYKHPFDSDEPVVDLTTGEGWEIFSATGPRGGVGGGSHNFGGERPPRWPETKFRTFDQARNAAVEWLERRGFKAEQPTPAKFGDIGKPIGMRSSDSSTGFRVEFDHRHQAHINVWSEFGRQKHTFIFEEGTQSMVDKIVKQFVKER